MLRPGWSKPKVCDSFRAKPETGGSTNECECSDRDDKRSLAAFSAEAENRSGANERECSDRDSNPGYRLSVRAFLSFPSTLFAQQSDRLVAEATSGTLLGSPSSRSCNTCERGKQKGWVKGQRP